MSARRTLASIAMFLLFAPAACAPERSSSGAALQVTDLRRVYVEGVRVDGGGTPVLLLKEVAGKLRRLPIWIGDDQARSIVVALEEIELPRPNTHDLTLRLLGGVEKEISRVVVTELRESTYYAVIEVAGDQLVQIDARPSDAIALAVRASAPIFVSNDVLNGGLSGSDDTEALDIRQALPLVDSSEHLGA